ncbi:hypothetical protein V5P93_006375 [Actinokineospora auranticolor]|uniref:Uncharacterized protein n=1 Tax=Actinokineospora auranticolor TaxID=155976 RepID=A0A2S6GFT1_9PSEU|nr:hypothetical protein [Actinokineospora auranticolor]PPK64060.1 hypothetical protein CLV40_12251 [Actinokineospora auranticolor]
MRFTRPLFAVLGTCALATAALPAAAAPAPAPAKGDVIVFQMEYMPVTVYENPSGCKLLPAGSHVLINRTDKVVTIYFDPACKFPIIPVSQLAPGNGTHVSPIGSFSI